MSDSNGDKDEIIKSLREETASLRSTVKSLQQAVEVNQSNGLTYYSSMNHGLTRENFNSIPDGGMAPRHVKELIIQNHLGDFTPR
mmetsp:Transcript_2035/g.3097  ORF Transcript_2035/g.3097 Transcript_2035/m.3097 type:complete len:85 (+) Transcript_2035:66-320(+)